MKLISMTEFVLELWKDQSKKEITYVGLHEFTRLTVNYANFLKQPLELGMFVPCVDGVPINIEDYQYSIKKMQTYLQAKENVLFDGCFIQFGEMNLRNDIAYKNIFDLENIKHLTIEYLANKKSELLKPTLTPNAIKQIGL